MSKPFPKAVFASALVTAFGGVSVGQAETMKMSDADIMKAQDMTKTQMKTGKFEQCFGVG